MKIFKKITVLTALLALICSVSSFAATPPIDSAGTWALWHMTSRTNWADPPALPWYIHDDSSNNPGRTNGLAIAGANVTGGVSGGGVPGCGNFLKFGGSLTRANSVNGWENPAAFYFECWIRPLDFAADQRIFELTSAISIRFAPNSSHTHGRVLFYHYQGGAAILANTGFGTAATLSNQWLHLTASVDPSGNKTITLDNCTDGTATGAVVDDVYAADPRAFIADSRSGGANFTGDMDEIKVGAIPEPMTFTLVGMALIALIIKRR